MEKGGQNLKNDDVILGELRMMMVDDGGGGGSKMALKSDDVINGLPHNQNLNIIFSRETFLV